MKVIKREQELRIRRILGKSSQENQGKTRGDFYLRIDMDNWKGYAKGHKYPSLDVVYINNIAKFNYTVLNIDLALLKLLIN